MTIQFYDTPSRAKRIFEPLEPGKVRMYSCGPTVWDYSHIGNFRCFLFYDVLKRYLLNLFILQQKICRLKRLLKRQVLM